MEVLILNKKLSYRRETELICNAQIEHHRIAEVVIIFDTQTLLFKKHCPKMNFDMKSHSRSFI